MDYGKSSKHLHELLEAMLSMITALKHALSSLSTLKNVFNDHRQSMLTSEQLD